MSLNRFPVESVVRFGLLSGKLLAQDAKTNLIKIEGVILPTRSFRSSFFLLKFGAGLVVGKEAVCGKPMSPRTALPKEETVHAGEE